MINIRSWLAPGLADSGPAIRPAADAEVSQRYSVCTVAGVTPTDELTYAIVNAARVVHLELGPGFTESIYNRALAMELKKQGLHVEREKVIKIWYGLNVVGTHRLDLVIGDAAIVELKASRGIIKVHMVQMNSYLHATDYPVGLILNFGMPELEYELVLSPKACASATTQPLYRDLRDKKPH